MREFARDDFRDECEERIKLFGGSHLKVLIRALAYGKAGFPKAMAGQRPVGARTTHDVATPESETTTANSVGPRSVVVRAGALTFVGPGRCTPTASGLKRRMRQKRSGV